jgi:hypothetical protein
MIELGLPVSQRRFTVVFREIVSGTIKSRYTLHTNVRDDREVPGSGRWVRCTEDKQRRICQPNQVAGEFVQWLD